jgi:hypothetical protein
VSGIVAFPDAHRAVFRARRSEETTMKRYLPSLQRQAGKLGYILLWALGVPIPVLLVIYLLRGCT